MAAVEQGDIVMATKLEKKALVKPWKRQEQPPEEFGWVVIVHPAKNLRYEKLGYFVATDGAYEGIGGFARFKTGLHNFFGVDVWVVTLQQNEGLIRLCYRSEADAQTVE